jgi:16S rRNA (adenine(1408)-N(1))-methyltransferase
MMRVVEGRKLVDMDGDAFARLAARHEQVVVDLGTGDGLFAYRLAAGDPATLYVGCDPAAGNMIEVSQRSRRNASRGGVDNLLLVVTSVEEPPDELRGVASQVYCVLPWGRLMAGLVTGDAEVLRGVRAFARPGAPVVVYLNVGVWDRDTPLHVQDLPVVTSEHIEQVLEPAYAGAGIRLLEHREAAPDEIGALRSSWARRLTHDGRGRFVRLEAVAC